MGRESTILTLTLQGKVVNFPAGPLPFLKSWTGQRKRARRYPGSTTEKTGGEDPVLTESGFQPPPEILIHDTASPKSPAVRGWAIVVLEANPQERTE